MIKLYHRKNEISIDLVGVQNPAAIELYYNGAMRGESQLPDGWHLASNQNHIICINFGNLVPELILNYIGSIKITSGRVIDLDSNVYHLNVVVEDIDYWEKMTVDFDKNTQYWEGLDSTHEKDSLIRYSSTVKNNLFANSGQFYFKDGTPYEGEYHQHGDGQAMTGSEHSEESEFIYSKNFKGELLDFRKGISKRVANETIRHFKKVIPSIRKHTKSDIQKAKDIKREISIPPKQVGISTKGVEVERRTEIKSTKGY